MQIFDQINFEITPQELSIIESIYEDEKFKEKIGYLRLLKDLSVD